MPACTGAEISLLAILTVKVFLILRTAFAKSTLEMFVPGKGVYKVESVEVSNFVVITLRSLTSITLEVGKAPSFIPEVVTTPTISIEVVPTETTFPKNGSTKLGVV